MMAENTLNCGSESGICIEDLDAFCQTSKRYIIQGRLSTVKPVQRHQSTQFALQQIHSLRAFQKDFASQNKI